MILQRPDIKGCCAFWFIYDRICSRVVNEFSLIKRYPTSTQTVKYSQTPSARFYLSNQSKLRLIFLSIKRQIIIYFNNLSAGQVLVLVLLAFLKPYKRIKLWDKQKQTKDGEMNKNFKTNLFCSSAVWKQEVKTGSGTAKTNKSLNKRRTKINNQKTIQWNQREEITKN